MPRSLYSPPEPTLLCAPPKRPTEPFTCYTAGPHPDAEPPFGRCQHCGLGRAGHSKVPVGSLLIYSEVVADAKRLAEHEQRDPGAVQDELAWHLVKYLAEDVRLSSEHEHEMEATANRGPAFFVIDLALTLPDGSRIGFDVSSNVRSLRDHDRLLRRDATLLSAGVVRTMYRLRGSDLLHKMEDVLYLASLWDPALFSARGLVNLRTLASAEVKAQKVRAEQPSVLVAYPLADDPAHETPERHLWHVANGQTPHILVRRLSVDHPAVWAPYATPA